VGTALDWAQTLRLPSPSMCPSLRLLPLALLGLTLAAPGARAQLSFTEIDAGIPPDSLDQGEQDEYYVTSVAPADVEADGDFDLRLVSFYLNLETETFRERLTLYRNDGPGPTETSWLFAAEDVPFSSGETLTGDLAWGDYDSDNDVDVVVATVAETVLYRNDDGALVPTGVELPLYDETGQFTPAPFDRRSLSWADYDNDGDLDLLIPSTSQGGGINGTMLLRNDGEGGPGGWTFSQVATDLPATLDAQTTWGDADNDGDLDLLLQENETFDTPGFARLFLNEGGTLVAGPAFADAIYGTADLGDFDSDGDLDVLVAGFIDGGADGDAVIRLFLRDGATYTPVDVIDGDGPGAWADVQAASGADYDGDGDVDLLATGLPNPGATGQSVVFVNDGGVFTPLLAEALPAPYDFEGGGGAFTWFDLDSDGDLDHFVSSRYFLFPDSEIPTSETHVYRNDGPVANAGPAAPAGLTAAVAGDAVTLGWGPAADDHTPSAGLTYNLWVRRPGSDIVSPMAKPNDGQRLVPEPGNVSHNTTWSLRDLTPGTYTWTVQAVDNAFNGGAFAAEGTFEVGIVAGEPGAGGPAFGLAVAPSPTRGRADVALTLDRAQAVTVAVYDALGRRVALAHDGELAAGAHRLPLGAALAPGTYLVRAVGAREAATARLVVLAR
jgi:hypothetical protein